MELQGVSVLVTGAASGMGKASTLAMAGAGAKVALFDLNAQALQTAATEVSGLAVACDVSSSDSVEVALQQVIAEQGCPRVLVNCAGVGTAGRIVSRSGPLPLDDFRKVIEVNLIGTFNVMRLVAAAMLELSALEPDGVRGVVINTASVAAYDGQIGQAAYSASKGGIVSLTLTAAREFASFGIRVMTIAPGLIATPMLLGFPQEVQDSLAAQVPFPKRLGQAEEYARLALHIIDNELLNGEVIRLDGAIRMQPR
ncbi:MAG TPA: SDR family NAD(P)-dependent oxidoreductase [Gammaproteobacteria bacterium]|nr:SDR family NAD(P)-dependent oxidoreductase [Gammaproteobacteria bacterium]